VDQRLGHRGADPKTGKAAGTITQCDSPHVIECRSGTPQEILDNREKTGGMTPNTAQVLFEGSGPCSRLAECYGGPFSCGIQG
jgi:hypothetical protein